MMNEQSHFSCRACGGNSVAETLNVREMMFGTREVFEYFRCQDCGCLQITAVPENIGDYYARDYYSCRKLGDLSPRLPDRLKRGYLYPRMTRSKLGWDDGFGKLLLKIGPGPPLQHWFTYLDGPVPLDLPILDVGCGSGEDLLGLRNSGFTQLLGIDPYLEKSLVYGSGIEVRKCQLSEVIGSFGLITLHHVFEHLDNPLETLITARKLLSQGGRILIRIPVSDSTAFDQYREDWAQLDAPRHITLQTRASMEHMAKAAGLKIIRIAYDSGAFQFWGSEQYRKDVPLSDPRSYSKDPDSGIFSEKEIEEFKGWADQLNRDEKGDQAAFVLTSDL